ncbi:thioesterase family protein [Conexibacter sp. DBS9H8]|uniref:thioesterase family protein n=1 Tax=Conexibacter sp. DBS9H8 TaxID=2937801 RepID=UPI00200DCAA2|nr:thioesterase family protein [Conexibacter sp. DBS9H8]
MDSVYELTGGGVFATEYARGPWDPNHQHGGAPAALLMRAFEETSPDPTLALTRVTYELIRPVPLGPLSVTAAVTRPGRRVQLLEGTISTPEGTEVVRARALRVRRAPVSVGADLSPNRAAAEAAAGTVKPPAGPSGLVAAPFFSDRVLFPGHGVEVRFLEGGFGEPGPGTAWFRLLVPLVAGERPTPLQRVAAACDFPNGIASELGWDRYVFINPDLTLYLEREPIGEWICLRAGMRVIEGGAGISQAVLYDESGRIGRSLQSLYVAERD